jgi:histidinol dehydrogenase
MRILDTSICSPSQIEEILTQRPQESLSQIESTVREILSEIQRSPSEAVVSYTRKLDWPNASINQLEADLQDDSPISNHSLLRKSAERIKTFHEAELESLITWRRDFGIKHRAHGLDSCDSGRS